MIYYLFTIMIYAFFLLNCFTYFIYTHIDVKSLEKYIFIKDKINNNNIEKILYLIKNNDNDNENIYFYIDSHGGDFDEAYRLVMHMEEVKNNKKIKFTCIAKNALSAAFIIFQYCDKRYVFDYSTLFQHEIEITLKGTIETLNTWYYEKFIILKKRDIKIKKYISDKIKIDYIEYNKKVKNNWNISGGFNIIKNNLADSIIYLH